MNLICNACNINIDENNYLKDRTGCKGFYKEPRKLKIKNEFCTSHQQPKIDEVKQKHDNNLGVSAYENHRYNIIGQSNSGTTYYLVKILENQVLKDPFI